MLFISSEKIAEQLLASEAGYSSMESVFDKHIIFHNLVT